MAYVNQIKAHLADARGRLAHAASRAEVWPECGKVLARAFEFAAAAVLIAWGDPYKATPKLHPAFLDRVAPLLDATHVALVSAVWAAEGCCTPVEDVAVLLPRCGQAIDYLADVATCAPPDGWQAPPVPVPVGWDALSDDERAFLQEASVLAQYWSPGVRLVLFGSRAAGQARPDSDCDLLLIFPGDSEEARRGLSIGDVTILGGDNGLVIDTSSALASEWNNLDEASDPFLVRQKVAGIEVPS
jgi:hypothetical protein